MTYPGLLFTESTTFSGFALQLYDGFTGLQQLEGKVVVSIAGLKSPLQKTDSATFVFLNIGAGTYSISVASSVQTPYYWPVNITVTLPLSDAVWQAYPDLSVGDPTKPIDDPSQPAAYRAQLALATLNPTPQYPFPPSATLVRGTVLAGGAPLEGATVLRVGDTTGATSAANGDFVLFFDDVSGEGGGQLATIEATHPLYPNPVDVQVKLQRATTVSIQMVMTP
jgi:hypothetical protein